MVQQAFSVPDAITRPLRAWEDWREKLPGWLNSLSVVVCQQLVRSVNHKLIPIIEWMEMTPETRRAIMGLARSARDPVHLRALMESLLSEKGHPFLEWAGVRREAGEIHDSVFSELARAHESRMGESLRVSLEKA